MMARLTDEQWACVRADYEVRGLSFSELAEKYKVGKATISDKKKKMLIMAMIGKRVKPNT